MHEAVILECENDCRQHVSNERIIDDYMGRGEYIYTASDPFYGSGGNDAAGVHDGNDGIAVFGS